MSRSDLDTRLRRAFVRGLALRLMPDGSLVEVPREPRCTWLRLTELGEEAAEPARLEVVR